MTTIEQTGIGQAARPAVFGDGTVGSFFAAVADWATSTDHKKIGRLYAGFGLLGLVGVAVIGVLLGLERTDDAANILPADSLLQLFQLHRVGLVFLVAIPLTLGLSIAVAPMQVGARSLAFARLALTGFYGWLGGATLVVIALAGNGGSLFTCISATGGGVFVSGAQALSYQVSTLGAVPILPMRSVLGFTGMAAVLRELATEAREHVLENAYNRVVARSLASESTLSSALGAVSLATPFPPGNPLAAELNIVARLIAARHTLGVKRQVFLCSLGGFDHHDGLMSGQPVLLSQVSQALAAFHAATVEMGVADKVTTFTGSDFGRALTSNGNGTDHGWGGHQFLLGGAVRGKAFYGTPPAPSIGETSAPDDQWHVGQGRLLPTTSVDQLAATLGRWFGATDAELRLVLPNLRNFGGTQAGISYPVDLGFMA